jgi:protein phosphatase
MMESFATKGWTIISNVTEISRNALNADSAEYIALIEESARLLASEKGKTGKLTIEGRLVHKEPNGEAIVVGDLHGDLESLIHILQTSGFMEKATQGKDLFLVFLGDYGDRGPYSAEIYYVALKMKLLFPHSVVLMRGNHEGPDDLMASPHDLPHNLQTRFGDQGHVVYSKIRGLFPHLSTGVLVDELCVLLHGGVPSRASSLEDVALAHAKHPQETHLEEILWSDPSEDITGTYPSPRGAGQLFGADVTQEFLSMLGAKLLIRGHEPSPSGFKTNHDGRILTLFSRRGPPYFNTTAAYLQFDLSIKPGRPSDLVSYVHKF